MDIKEIEQIVLMYKQGASLRDIGKKLEVSQSTICKYVSRARIKRRGIPHGGRPSLVPFDPKPTTRFGILEVIERDPRLYPTRWRCKCIHCKQYILADKVQLLRKRDSCTHKSSYIPRWKRRPKDQEDAKKNTFNFRRPRGWKD